MATQFTATVKPSGGDYTSLHSAVTGLANDLTAADIKVFSISAYSTPTISAGDTVLGQTSGATGVCVLVNASRTQILIETIAVASFLSGEIVQKTADANVNVTLSNTGDSPIVGIECYSMTDTTAVTIVGYTTSATNYIYIYTPLSARHNGIWNDAKYNLTVTDAIALNIQEDYVNIEGLQITSISPTAHYRYLINFADITYTLNQNQMNLSCLILKGHKSASYIQYGVYAPINNLKINMWNSIIYNITIGSGLGNRCFSGVNLNQTTNLYSVTAIGGYRGIAATDAKNCYVGDSDGTCFYNTLLTTCASSDTTGSVGLQNIAVNTTNFRNVSSGTEDFRLSPGSSLIDVGTDTSSDPAPLNFTTDIKGLTRPLMTAWDIGSDEYFPTKSYGIII